MAHLEKLSIVDRTHLVLVRAVLPKKEKNLVCLKLC